MPKGLPRKSRPALTLQALLGSIVITIGLLVAVLAVRQFVVNERMEREAALFWAAHAQDAAAPLLRTSTVAAYLDRPGMPDPDLPPALRDAKGGTHWLPMMLDGERRRSVMVGRP